MWMYLGWVLWDWYVWLRSFLFELVVWSVIVCLYCSSWWAKHVCHPFVFSELFHAVLNHGALCGLSWGVDFDRPPPVAPVASMSCTGLRTATLWCQALQGLVGTWWVFWFVGQLCICMTFHWNCQVLDESALWAEEMLKNGNSKWHELLGRSCKIAILYIDS